MADGRLRTGRIATASPVFIGDEITAAGYRLGGALTYTPAPEDAWELLKRISAESNLILLSVEYARLVPASELRALLRSPRPLLLIVPDALNRFSIRDLPARLRRLLGVAQ